MTVQNPAKPEILFSTFEDNEEKFYTINKNKTEEMLLEKSRKRAFLCYQFGCWTTAHSRMALEIGINKCMDDLLYVDTDSCKFIMEHDFSDYNEEQKKLSLESGLYATDKKGIVHYGGVYEFDNFYPEFITYGAKKYAYTDNKGEVHVTVSGVGKIKGAEQLKRDGGLTAFSEGYVFHNCGKTASIYNDKHYGKIIIDGHELEISRNVVIEDKDYTLSLAGDYSILLNSLKADIVKSGILLKNTYGETNF